MEYVQKSFGQGNTLVYAWFAAMHTRVDIALWTNDNHNKQERSNDSPSDLSHSVFLPTIVANIQQEVKRVETFANRFDPDSELSRINRMAFEQPVTVSEELFALLTECMTYTPLTLGYFDITINSFNGFKQGIHNITTDPLNRTIRFLHPDVQLDLSGYIKGYVLRAIRNMLEQEGISNALVNMGNSSILALGNHPHGEGWKISLPVPASTDKTTLLNTPASFGETKASKEPGTSGEAYETNDFLLLNECLSTSGNRPDRPWPVLNPSTHEATQRSAPVSARTTDPALGEVLSTALYLAEEEDYLYLNQIVMGTGGPLKSVLT